MNSIIEVNEKAPLERARTRRGLPAAAGPKIRQAAWVLVGLLIVPGQPGADASDAREKRVLAVLGLTCPLDVAVNAPREDGGPVSGGFIWDSRGHMLKWAYDGMIEVALDHDFDRVRRHLYIGATHTEAAGATKLEIGSEREHALCDALRLYCEQILAESEGDSLNVALDSASSDDRGRILQAMTENKRDALELWPVIHAVEAQARASASADSVVASLFKAMSMSARMQTFRMGSAPVANDSEAREFAGYRIESPGPVPNAKEADSLLRLVVRARRAKCDLPRPCEFVPRYGFRYFDSSPPLDLLIAADCQSFRFSRGDVVVAHFESCDSTLTGPLDDLMSEMFRDGGEDRQLDRTDPVGPNTKDSHAR